MRTSKIEWTETTWNPTTGCNRISSGCLNCYAERMSARLQAMGVEKYKDGFELRIHPEILDEPYTWRKPRTVFVNSMSDLFHENMSLDFIKKIFKVMNDNPIHTFQVLTKRAEILLKYSTELNWTKNIWIGVTVENQDNISRVDYLRKVKANVRFLSIEPLIGEINNLNLKKIDWVIVGGESGHGARPMKEDWVINLKEQCLNQNTPFFFKQWGGVNKKKNGRLLDGKTWDEMPLREELILN
jgi:protein gp37